MLSPITPGVKPSQAHALSLPAYRYTKTFDTSASGASARGFGVTTDKSGNIYVTGSFRGSVIFDGVGGSDSHTDTGGNGNVFLTKYNANGSYGWTKTFDSTGSGNPGDEGDSVAVDNNGNIFITGVWFGTVNFDGVGGSDSRTTTRPDYFLTKYNANGSYGYTKIFDANSSGVNAHGYGVTTDTSGNVYVTGIWFNTVVFDGVGGSDSRTSANGNSFLTKYNANGSYGWTKTADANASGASIYGAGIAIDSLGNIYITGDWNSTVVFDGVGGSDSKTSANLSSYITKYNANGSYGWTKVFNANASGAFADGYSIAIDSSNNVFVTGDWQNTIIFDGVGGSDSRSSANYNGFLTKYNANGSYGWTKTFDDSASGAFIYGNSVATDSLSNIYIAGSWSGTVVFDGVGGSDSQTTSSTNSNFLTKYNSNGNYGWTKTPNTTNGQSNLLAGGSVATDTLGNVYTAGDWQNTIIFDGVGGSDSRSSVNATTFLTSFIAFITPNPMTPLVPATQSTIKAPNTGYGTSTTNLRDTLGIYSFIALSLICLAVTLRKLNKTYRLK